MKTVVEQLTEARDSLTPENWSKGEDYFVVLNNRICMCSHGVVQLATKSSVREAFDKISNNKRRRIRSIKTIEDAVNRNAASVASAGAYSLAKYDNIYDAWENKPWWIPKDNSLEEWCHYVLGMVGLTTMFNDNENTTFDMVIEKFNQAIEAAKALNI